MKPNDAQLVNVQALVAFGRVGVIMAAARIATFLALAGFFAVCFDVVYAAQNWYGVAVCAIAGLFAAVVARAEAARHAQAEASNVETTQ